MQNENLEEVMRTEAEIAEVLLGLVKQQQNAIVHFQEASLRTIMQQQEDLLRPFQALEAERVRLMNDAVGLKGIPLPPAATKLQKLAREIDDLNQQNKTLLESSMRFIHGNIRILTEDFSRQLVDARM
jgi:flagellar biosynthesis/type III secretory pathway chaperone